MRCQACNKNANWFVKITRYDSIYDPTNFEWCLSCAYHEMKISYDEEQEAKEK